MFDYEIIKVELEQLKCPLHGKSARVSFVEGRLRIENVCCEVHKKALMESIPAIEDKHEMEELEEILEDIFY